MLACFCVKKKKPRQAIMTLEVSDSRLISSRKTGLPDEKNCGESEDVDSHLKLAELKTQFLDAQRRLKPSPRTSEPDYPIGYMDIPLYQPEGGVWKNAGKSFPLVLYSN
jgi:hypothetical protein